MGDIHVHFHQACGPTPRSESNELQNLRINAAEGLPQKVHNVHGMTLAMFGLFMLATECLMISFIHHKW